MLKTVDGVKELTVARDAVRRVLNQVSALEVSGVEGGSGEQPDEGVDFKVRLRASGRRHTLLCDVKANGQPRHVRTAVLRLQREAARERGPATPVLVAPYLSPQARAICRDEAVGFLDLEGNAWIRFDSVYIEREVASRPPAVRRAAKSIFKPKSARVLRALLRDPTRAWRVSDLATQAGVSLGQISNVRARLLEREWARVAAQGLVLTNPELVLDAWRADYDLPAGKRTAYYTALHGPAFEEAARNALLARRGSSHAAFASFSAAQWLAPYARVGSHSFYADEAGLEALLRVLALSPVAKGENVVVTVLKDDGPLRDAVEQAPGIVCTSPVQTYLDLYASGERGREAAGHLRRAMLAWPS